MTTMLLSTNVEEVWTVRGLFVGKSRVWYARPEYFSQAMGEIVLNAELKPTNSILM